VKVQKKLRRFFHEVRREAKRNPAFAARLEAALDAMAPDAMDADDLLDGERQAPARFDTPEPEDVSEAALDLNPAAIVRRDGPEALTEVLRDIPETALRGLILEHNLDPAGETARLNRAALVDHIVRQAERRIARDKKLFDY
jgi:hypothetical protein